MYDGSGPLRHRTLLSHPGVSQRVSLIPDGVAVTELREARPIAYDHPLLIVASRLEQYKNVHMSISALKYLPANTKLAILGDGPERMRLKALADRLDIGNRVQFLGSRSASEVRSWFAAADAVLCLSARESFGLVVLEALCAGAPVVASDIAPHREIAQVFADTGRHFVSAAARPWELAHRLQAVLQTGRRAEAHAPDWEHVTARTHKVYQTAIGRQRSSRERRST